MHCGNVKQGSHWNQITFLTEWQLYAQKVEGAEWKGHRLDKGVIDRMSGEFVSPATPPFSYEAFSFWARREGSKKVIPLTFYLAAEEQLGQLYELLQTIQNPDEGGSEGGAGGKST